MIEVRDWGLVDYQQAWQAMRDFTMGRDGATPDELWVVEHPPVFTLGQAGRHEHLRATGDIPIVATDRGGQVTYHGPGQVVVYTLIDLRRAGFFVRELVYRIEQSVIQVLDALDVVGERVQGAPGIYVRVPALGSQSASGKDAHARFAGMAKIAALGIKVHRGASYHGVALNVAMDLAPFALIDPCGYRGLSAVDLATLGVRIERRAAAARLVERLQAHLSA